jgi:autotransporter-associated beta strand protein
MQNATLGNGYQLSVRGGSNVASGTAGLQMNGTVTMAGNGSIALLDNLSGLAASKFTANGTTGSGNLTLKNNSSNSTSSITLSTTSVNHNGTITNSGSGSGSVLISSNIGTNVTGVIQNSANSALTLSGSNTYTGATTINAGTLSIASITNGGVAGALGNSTNAAGNLVLGGGTLEYTGSTSNSTDRNFTLTAGTTSGISVSNAAGSLTISGTSATTSGNLTKLGAGTLTLTGSNTYTGATTITAGTLAIATTGQLGSGNYAANIVNNGTFLYNGINSQTLSGVISGTGVLTKNNANSTLTLSGNNTYDGVTTVTAGTLAGVGANAFGSTSNISIAGAGTLSLRGDTSTAFIKASDSSPITVSTSASGVTFNVDQATGNGTAAKTMTLGAISTTSTAATYTLNFTGGNNTGLTVGAITGPASTATATVTLANANTSGLLTIASFNSASTNATVTETLTLSGAGNTTITGAITPAAAALGLSITNTGTTTLNGNNTYTGGTSITLGANATVIVGHKNALGTGNLTLSSSAGTTLFQANTDLSGSNAIANNVLLGSNVVTISGSNNITITGNWTNGGTIRTLTSSLDSGKTLVLAGPVNLTDGVGSYGLILTGTGDTTISGNITPGTGLTAPVTALDIRNSATTRLSGNNTWSGITRLLNGTTVMDSATALPSTSNLLLGGGILGLGTGNTAFTRALGTSAGQIRWLLDASGSNQGGFAAYGANATVNLGGASGAVVWGTTSNFIIDGWTFLLGSASANATVDFQNPLGLGTSGTNTRNIQVNNGSAATDAILSGVISGDANQTFAKTGTGTLLLTGNNTYSGATTISAGTLEIGSAGRLGGGSYSGNITNDGTLIYSGASSQTLSGVISGTGALTQNNSASTLTLSGSNTYSGVTTVNAGTLSIATINAASDLVLGNGTLQYTGSASATTDRNFTLTAGTTSTINVTSSTASLTISGASATTGALTKAGAGTLVLSGANTYTGATTVNAGTLSVLGSLSTSSPIAVNNGGALTGNGTVGAITIASGGSINPGAGVGTINTGGVTLNAGGAYNWQLFDAGGTAGSGWDLLSSTGALTLNSTQANPFIINLSTAQNQAGAAGPASVFNNTGSYTWRLAEFGSAISGFSANLFSLNATGFQNASGNFSLNATGNFLNLVYATSLQSLSYTAGTGNWSTAANWSSNSLPTSSDALTINGTGGTSTNDLLSTVQSLAIASSAGSYTLAGSGNGSTITLNGGITNSSSNDQTISMGINLGANQVFQSDGNLLLSGALGTSNRTLTLTGAGNVSITNTISGNGAILKAGEGTLTLNGTNTYTGSTTVTAGTLTLNGGFNNSSVTVSGGLLNQTATGTIAGTGTTFSMTGGNATLAGNNTYTGATTISAGTLEIASTGRLGGGSYAGNIANNGTFIYSGTNSQTLSGIISGTGELTQNNSSTLTLSGNNTYSGATTINGGTLQIASTGRLGSGSYAGNIANNGTFIYSGTNNQTLSGIISGSGALTQNNSASKLTLSGNNTYSGTTTISVGTLEIGSTGRLGGGSYEGDIANNGTFIYSGTNNQTLSGIISGSGALTQNVANSTLTLSGNNTYTGATTISAGTLSISSIGNVGENSAIGAGSIIKIGGGGTSGYLSYTGGGATTNKTIDLSGTTGSAYIFQNGASDLLKFTSNFTASGSGIKTLFLYGTGLGEIAGSIVNSSGGVISLQKSNAGTWTLSGNNSSFTGIISVTAGALSITSIGDVGQNSAAGAGAEIKLGSSNSSATLVYTGAGNTTNRTINLAGTTGNATIDQSGTGTLKFTSDFTAAGAGSKTLFLQGSTSGIGEIAGAVVNYNATATTSLTKNGTGTWILSGANTYTGNTIINAGTLQIAKAASLYNATTANWTASRIRVASGGTLAFNVGNSTNGEFTQAQVNTLLSNLTGSNSTATTGMRSGSTFGFDTTNADGGSFTIAGVVQNGNSNGNQTVGLTKLGTGTLTLTGNNTYSGATTISVGTLEIASTGRLGGGSYAGNIANAGTFIYSGSNGQTLSGIISGSGALTQNGTGTLTLTGNNTYSGATTISAGNLSISGVSALTNTSGVNLANTTALIYTGGSNATLDRAISVTGATGSTGTLRNTGGALTLTGGLSKNGTTLTFDSGTFNVNTVGISGSAANSDLVIDGAIVNLNIANTYNGPTRIIDGGTLNANVTNALPTDNGRTAISIDATGTGNSTLALGASQSIASLTGAASSNVTLGSNTLTIGTASGNTTYAGRITGSGGLVKDGASTQVLSGNNSAFAGTTTVSAGTLQAAATKSMGGSTVINVTGGSFLVTADDAVNDNAAINLGGGTMALNGNVGEVVGQLTLSANSTLDMGTGNSWVSFAGLVAQLTNTTRLNVYNYTPGSDGVYFTDSTNVVNSLNYITFYSDFGQTSLGNAFFSPPELHSAIVPEPGTYVVGLLLLGGIAIMSLKRKRNADCGLGIAE